MNRLSRGVLLLAFGITIVLGQRSPRSSLPAQERGRGYTVFSIDDYSIPYKENLKLTLVQPEKYSGNPVVRRGPSGSVDESNVTYYGSVIRVEQKFRMWYVAASWSYEGTTRRRYFRIAYAESDDGIRWVKPELGLTTFKGSTRNNLVRMAPELDYTLVQPLACFVLYEPEDPDPGRRYKMAMYACYQNRTKYPGVSDDNVPSTLYPYFSADGLDWKLALPAPKGKWLDETEVPFRVRNNFEIGGLYRFDGIYYAAGQELWPDISLPDGRPVRRTMVTHWSGDFVHWSQDKSFSFQRHGYRSVSESLEEAHEPAGVWNRGNVLVGLYGLWHGATISSERRMDLGLLVSNDGIHFREPIADRVFIPAGVPGEWDQYGLLQGQGFENVGDQTYLYYGNWDMSKEESPCDVGLARMRRDGFGFLSTIFPGAGMFTTTWFPGKGHPLSAYFNVDGLSSDSYLRVELIDKLGNAIPGYSDADAALVKESGLRVQARWPRGLQVEHPNLRLRIKFAGRAANQIRFYAAYIE